MITLDKRDDPTMLSDHELKETYKSVWGQGYGNYKDEVVASLLVAEMNRRYSKRAMWWSLGISILALVIALTSAIFSFLDWKGDFKWQTEQLSYLSEISGNLKKQ